jgi:hypothetical protein
MINTNISYHESLYTELLTVKYYRKSISFEEELSVAVITRYLAQWPFIKGGIFFLWKTQYLYLLFRSLGYFRQKRMETRYGIL